MQSGSHTLLRTAPWTRAPTLAFREPAVALVIIGVALVIGVVAASGPLFDASTGSAALALEMSQECAPDLGTVAIGYGPLDHVDQTNATLSTLSSRLLRTSGAPADSLDSPVVTLNAPITVGTTRHASAPAQLVTHPGGLGQIDRVASAGGRGVWISTDLASEVHVRPGGHLLVAGAEQPGGSEKPTAQVRVAGTYRSLVGTVLPPFWCSLKGVFGTPDENAPPPPVILTTTATFTRILGEAGVHTLSSYRWEQPPSSGVDLEQAESTATAIAGFQHRVGTTVSRSGVPGHRIPDGYRLVDEDPDQYGFLVTHAQSVQRAVSQGVEPEIVAGVVVGLLLLGSASVFWAYRRRTEITLLLSRGVAPGSIGIKAGLEAVPLMGIGAALGWIGSIGLLALVGPSSAFGSSALVRSAVFVIGAEALALVLLAALGAPHDLSTQARTHPCPVDVLESALRAHRDRPVPLALAVLAERLARSRGYLRSGRAERLPDHAADPPPQRVDPLRPIGQHRPAAGPRAHASARSLPRRLARGQTARRRAEPRHAHGGLGGAGGGGLHLRRGHRALAGVHPHGQGPDTGGLKHRSHHPQPGPAPAFPGARARPRSSPRRAAPSTRRRSS